ncbi:uncharacterized protein QC763_0028970 [Podospora pseudopauciseta]|uniref:Uncharacterized protein n=1 Tax=Podospora pseudopauciseta TaxID=2093780 RepID=A0ABR0HLV8_9PEZI|nr:hypothetical protein QC763_0028970 [Podospora pseudopauciseta]
MCPEEKKDLVKRREVLEKLTAMNLLVAFAVALKHKLRFEPYTCYEDISSLISHLDTFAKVATEEDPKMRTGPSSARVSSRAWASTWGVVCRKQPTQVPRRLPSPPGQPPLEILSYLASFTDELALSGRLPVTMHQTMAYNNIMSLNDVQWARKECSPRRSPLPTRSPSPKSHGCTSCCLPARQGAGWITIPLQLPRRISSWAFCSSVAKSKTLLARTSNDLPLEAYAAQVAAEMDVIASRPVRPSYSG